MLLIIPFGFFAMLLPVFCIGVLARDEAHPTVKAMALLILSPYVFIVIRILRNIL